MKHILSLLLICIFSCTKTVQQHATITANLYYLFPGAIPIPQATSDTYLPGDSVTMEYKGNIYKTGVIYKQLPNDTSIHILNVKDVNGVIVHY